MSRASNSESSTPPQSPSLPQPWSHSPSETPLRRLSKDSLSESSTDETLEKLTNDLHIHQNQEESLPESFANCYHTKEDEDRDDNHHAENQCSVNTSILFCDNGLSGSQTNSSIDMSRPNSPFSLSSYAIGHQTERSIHQIPIYIETLTGTTFEVQIMPQETIFFIKHKLETEEGIPAVQQHLIWQGEELKNEYTLEEYGIGFGAILRLVLDVRGGPVSESPAAVTSASDEVDETQGSTTNLLFTDDSRPLTVLIFQNGNQIRMLTIGSDGGSYGSSSTGLTRTSISDGGTDLERESHSKGSESSSRNGSRQSTRTKSAQKKRELENEAMKGKMEEIQRRIRLMSLKKSSRKGHQKSPDVTRLPTIEDSKKHSHNSQAAACNSHDKKQHLAVHLPSLVPNSFPSTSRNPIKESSVCVEANQLRPKSLKQILLETMGQQRSRSNSLSPKAVLVSRGINKRTNEPLFFQLSTTPESSETEVSVCGSLTLNKAKPARRPQTMPLLGKINEMRKFPTLKEIKALANSKSNYSRMQRSGKRLTNNHTSNNNSNTKKTSDHHTLPPVVPAKKVRCFLCKKRLGLAARYECRCGPTFCAAHRYSEAHNCSFDYRGEGRKILQRDNPLVRASKLPKI